jgi:hypothetical protein
MPLDVKGAEMREPTLMERKTFGDAVKIHPITDRPIEHGVGSLPEEVQAELHCRDIEQEQGKAAADAIRAKLREVRQPAPKQEQTL